MIISKRFTFEASHILPLHPGKCSRLHGHSWGLRVSVSGPIDPYTGMVMDYASLGNLVREHVVEHLDHTHLGVGMIVLPDNPVCESTKDRPVWPYYGVDFYPTSENLAKKIFSTLHPLITKENQSVRIHEITIEETCTSAATYRDTDAWADNHPGYTTRPDFSPIWPGAERGPCPHCGGSGKA